MGRKKQFTAEEARLRKNAQHREYYQKNKEKIKEQVYKWIKENPEKHSKNVSKYITKRRVNDPEFRKLLNERNKKWRENNPEQYKISRQKFLEKRDKKELPDD